ncbi:kinase-like domain-containing protein [Mycena pura]|uniref:Kinase-like domain-containing protein n=1 Tax=Mycena pura TaxID=153505 RepID=A0AAD6VTR9_9AGAR|nr:kinase-like domain-containing protein [Mycena pura]
MFDFSLYLASQLALTPADFRVDVLTGGLTNSTVRATFVSPVYPFNSQQPMASVVLKHAPYVASDPDQPMSVYQQTIEANALRYLAGRHDVQDLMRQFLNLEIPRLVHHDDTANVIWITDLGVSQTLEKFLATPGLSSTAVRELANTLGTFSARFWDLTARPSPEVIAAFERPVGPDSPAFFLVSTAHSIMSKRAVPDADTLSARIGTVMKAKEGIEPCLGMVDFWPGSILIRADGSLGLVDWEYFGLSTPGAEIGMLVAHLHLIISNHVREPEVCAATRTFISAFLDSYAAHAAPTSMYFKRQALVSYGREMVTALEFFATDLDEETKGRVLNAGVRTLRAAAASESEMDRASVDVSIAHMRDGSLQ